MASLPLVVARSRSTRQVCLQLRAYWCFARLHCGSPSWWRCWFQGRLRAGSDVGFESAARARGSPALFHVVKTIFTATCGLKLDLGVQLVMALSGMACWVMKKSWCSCGAHTTCVSKLHAMSLVTALADSRRLLGVRESWAVWRALHTGAGPWWSCSQGHDPHN